MKILSLIFMLIFSFTVLADSCLAIDFEDDCHTSQSKDGHEETHCARTCTPKILGSLVLKIIFLETSTSVIFPQYIENQKSTNPLPLLEPPIA